MTTGNCQLTLRIWHLSMYTYSRVQSETDIYEMLLFLFLFIARLIR